MKVEKNHTIESIAWLIATVLLKAIYQSDMQYEIVKLEAAILHEKYMLPFKYLLVVFVVAVLGLIIYSI